MSHAEASGSSQWSAAQLEQFINQGSRDYSVHCQFLQTLQQSGDQQRLEEHRQLMKNSMYCGLDFWRSWTTDMAAKSASGEVDPEAVLQRFRQALSQCPDVNLWLDYIDYVQQLTEENEDEEDDNEQQQQSGKGGGKGGEDLRKVFEDAITAVGVDMLYGPAVWKRYREWEQEEYQDLQDVGADAAKMLEAKTRLIKLYRRQLSVPLIGNEEVLAEFDTLLSEICTERDTALIDPETLQMMFSKAIAERDVRLPYEDRVTSESFSQEPVEAQLASWTAYIKLELDEKNYARAQRLFFRAVMSLPQAASEPMWKEFCDFACLELQNWKLLSEVTENAVKCCYWSCALWKYRLVALERVNAESAIVDATVQSALASGLASAEDYLAILLAHVDYYRRKVNGLRGRALAPAVERVNERFQAAEAVLEQYYPTWDMGFLTLYKYEASAAANLGSVKDSATRAKAVWDKAVKKLGKFLLVWQEYIAWARSVRDNAHARALYRRAIHIVSDYPAQICDAWVEFEQQTGTLDELDEAVKKTQKKKAQIAQTTAQQATKAEVTAPEPKRPTKKAVKEAPKAKAAAAAAARPPKAAQRVEASTAEKPMDIPSAAASAEAVATSEPEQVSRKRKPETALGQQPKVSKPEAKAEAPAGVAQAAPALNAEPNTVFVKNLSFAATAADIRQAFAQFGPVREVRLVEKNGKSRGMAYVVFEPNKQVDVVEQVLAASAAPEIRGRPVVVKRSYVQTQAAGDKHQTGPAWPTHPTTVYVSGLPAEFTQEQLVAMFESCGAIDEARLVLDKRTQQPKGTALVQFQEETSVEEALKLDGQQIGGGKGTISVTRSRFPAAQPTSAAERVRPHVESKAKLTDFAPRIVTRKPKLAAAPASAASNASAAPQTTSTNTSTGGSGGGSGSNATGSLTNEHFRNLFK